MRYVVTGGTGFLERRVATHLLDRYDDAEVWVSVDSPPDRADHVVNCKSAGTEAALALSRELGATLHQLSSVAVAGDFAGEYTEDDLNVGQQLPTRRHRAAFDAEQLVRLSSDVRWRIYRTGVIVGDFRTGQSIRITGPYHVFGLLTRLTGLLSVTRIPAARHRPHQHRPR